MEGYQGQRSGHCKSKTIILPFELAHLFSPLARHQELHPQERSRQAQAPDVSHRSLQHSR